MEWHLCFFYEILRLLRWFFKHGIISIWIEDILYWGMASIPTFYIFFIYNDGNIRWYGLLMLLTGAFLYEMGLSRPVRRFLVKIFGRHRPYLLKKFIKKMKKKIEKNKKDDFIKKDNKEG